MDGVKKILFRDYGSAKSKYGKNKASFSRYSYFFKVHRKSSCNRCPLYGLSERQDRDIESFKKDESVIIPEGINYEKLSGLSNEIKIKLTQVKPKTLGQAIRIDGVTPAAIIIFLSHIKKLRYKASA